MLSLFLLILLSPVFTLPTTAQQLCNGHAELCNRKWSNITTIGTHDSAFVGNQLTDNQDLDVTAQLNAGIRFLQAQTHKNFLGTLSMCHTSCFELDAGPLTKYLDTIETWLTANPNEVVTLLLVNGDNLPASDFDTAFASSGLKQLSYTPSTPTPSLDQWPTLSTLISQNTRLISFLDTGAAKQSTAPYLLDEFSLFFETPYDTTDPTFPECTLDRPANGSPDGKMYIVNHFLDLSIGGIHVPDDAADNTTNAATGVGSIGSQVGICEGLYHKAPVGILVDYFDKGDVFTAQNAANGL